MRQESSIETDKIIANTYRILSKLGEGGMGEVWKAEHLRLPGLNVAIKFLSNENVSEDQFTRFQREAHIMASLHHPHITRVIDLNTLPEEGTSYIILEYLEGESLRERLDREPLNFEEIRTILTQVGSALSATHSQQIVHRDLKPDNIYLSSDGESIQVKVLDFGVSKVLSASKKLTVHQQGFLGTPHYMSPEQALGVEDVTAYADQFALAIILYEMLTGELPFDGDQVIQIATQIVQVDPPYILDKLPSLGQNAADVIHRALSKTATDRFDTCDEFVQAFLNASQPSSESLHSDDWSQGTHTEIQDSPLPDQTIKFQSLHGVEPFETLAIDHDLHLDEDQTSITQVPVQNEDSSVQTLFSQSAPDLTSISSPNLPNEYLKKPKSSLGLSSNGYGALDLTEDEIAHLTSKPASNLGKIALYASMLLVILGFVITQLGQSSNAFDCTIHAQRYEPKAKQKKLFLSHLNHPKKISKSINIYEPNNTVHLFLHKSYVKANKAKYKVYWKDRSSDSVNAEQDLVNLQSSVVIDNKKYYRISKKFSSDQEGEWEAIVELKQRKTNKRSGKRMNVAFCVGQ